MREEHLRGLGAIAAFLGPMVVYGLTASRDIGAIDSGELAAVCAGLGIAHPTGYPLYTLVGRLAVLAIPAGEPIARLNLLSAFFAAFSAFFVFHIFMGIARLVRPESMSRGREILALGGAWLWALHPALWSQATGNEVHALQGSLVTGLLALAQSESGRRGSLKINILASYVAGLAFTNHMSVIYLVPGLIAGAILDARSRALLARPRMLLLLMGAFAAPLTLYLYLPLRASGGPILDWGDPQTVERLIRHIGGAQYRVWMFTSSASFDSNIASFAHEIVSPMGVPLLLAALYGVTIIARRDPPSLARFGLGLLIGTLWASGYDIHDIEPYYMLPRLCLGGLAVAGCSAFLPSIRSTSKAGLGARLRWSAVALPLIASVLLGGVRWKEQDRAGDRFVRLYASSLLDRLPPRSILFSRHWDMVVSPLIYMQRVEGSRPDVTVVDTELLRRSWYFQELRRIDPSLLAPIEARVTPFLEDLRLFEAEEPYDPRRIEEHYRGVITGIFEAHRGERPVFYTPDVEPTFYPGWYGIPEALDVRIALDPSGAPETPPLDPGQWAAQARYVSEPVRRDAWAFPIQLGRSRVQFLERFGREREARAWSEAVAGLEAVPLPAE